MSVVIHPTAIVEKGAELDEGVTVGPYSIVGSNVKIGAGSRLQSHVVVSGHTTLGRENVCYQFSSIGSPPQDLKYNSEPTELIIGDHNTIREYVTLQPGTIQSTAKTVVGSNNLFMVNSHVAHDCRVGSDNVFANSVALAGHVTIGNRAILGGLCAIHQFARIGDFAFIGGGAMVSRDVPPFAMVQGDRAKLVGMNVVGMRRAGFKVDTVKAIKAFYKEVLFAFGPFDDRLKRLPEAILAIPEVQALLDFCRSSKRGVVVARQGADSEGEAEL